MELPLIHFNVLTLNLLGYDKLCNTTIFVNDNGLKIQNVDTRFHFFLQFPILMKGFRDTASEHSHYFLNIS